MRPSLALLLDPPLHAGNKIGTKDPADDCGPKRGQPSAIVLEERQDLVGHRCTLLPIEKLASLNGEVDKQAHALLHQLGVCGKKPDLLVHRPGYMEDNHAVIEVKHANASSLGILKDLRTLTLFRNQAGYQRSIYLIYGDTANGRFAKRIERAAGSVECTGGVEIWLHSEVHAPATQFGIQ